MLIIKPNTKQYISSFLVGLYALLIGFASNLHNHHHPNYKNVDAQKFQKQYSEGDNDVLTSDCWSCHFLSHQEGILHQDFSFEAYQFSKYNDLELSVFDRIISSSHYVQPLRGPPSNPIF